VRDFTNFTLYFNQEARMKTTRLLFASLLILVLLIVMVIPVMAASPGQGDQPPQVQVPDAVLLLISAGIGGLCVKIVNFLKERLGWTKDTDKVKNVWLTFGIAVFMGILLLLITSSFAPLTGPESVVTWITLAFTVATLLYKSMTKSPESTTPQ
jgi:hypothetical protein